MFAPVVFTACVCINGEPCDPVNGHCFCDCHDNGSDFKICDEIGQCACKWGYIGKLCNQCDKKYYGFPNCKGRSE